MNWSSPSSFGYAIGLRHPDGSTSQAAKSRWRLLKIPLPDCSKMLWLNTDHGTGSARDTKLKPASLIKYAVKTIVAAPAQSGIIASSQGPSGRRVVVSAVGRDF